MIRVPIQACARVDRVYARPFGSTVDVAPFPVSFVLGYNWIDLFDHSLPPGSWELTVEVKTPMGHLWSRQLITVLSLQDAPKAQHKHCHAASFKFPQKQEFCWPEEGKGCGCGRQECSDIEANPWLLKPGALFHVTLRLFEKAESAQLAQYNAATGAYTLTTPIPQGWPIKYSAIFSTDRFVHKVEDCGNAAILDNGELALPITPPILDPDATAYVIISWHKPHSSADYSADFFDNTGTIFPLFVNNNTTSGLVTISGMPDFLESNKFLFGKAILRDNGSALLENGIMRVDDLTMLTYQTQQVFTREVG